MSPAVESPAGDVTGECMRASTSRRSDPERGRGVRPRAGGRFRIDRDAGVGSKVRSGMRMPIIKRPWRWSAPCERDPALPTMAVQVGGLQGEASEERAALGQLCFCSFCFYFSRVTLHK